MARRLSYFNDDMIGLIVDMKQDVCAENGFGIATLLGTSKDQLRTTTFGTNAAGKRVQGRAYTTHGQLILQGLLNVEATPHFVLLFKAACWFWRRCRCKKAPLETLYIVMMKDYAPRIEGARKIVFGNGHSRPLNDVFHMHRAQKHLQSLLTKTTLNESAHQGLQPQVSSKRSRKPPHETKTHLDWITSSWITNRRLPTLDLFSEKHQANLGRIQYEFGEVAAAMYLGNGSDSYYTKRLPVDILERDCGMVFWNPDRNYELSFAYHWSRISNMIHGTDCGSTPVEAANSVHAAFEQQLKNWAMKQQQGANILKDMQKLYHDEHRRAYGWDGSEPHFLYPPTEDPALLNGQALLNAGRATAIVFWEHQQAWHSVHHTEQLTPELEITSMPVNTRVELECAL